jgi:hypothetical protein
MEHDELAEARRLMSLVKVTATSIGIVDAEQVIRMAAAYADIALVEAKRAETVQLTRIANALEALRGTAQ